MKFDWNRLNSAVIVGVLLRCPSALFTYRIVNPWYINRFYPWLLPGFTKNFTSLKKTFLAVIFDVFVYKWFSTFVYMGGTHLIEKSKGDFGKTFAFIKDNYWIQMKATFLFYIPYKWIIYAWIPFLWRNIIAHIFSCFWAIIFSFL